jgi:hypothetical protein
MHHQVQQLRNLGLKGLGFDGSISGRHLDGSTRVGKHRYSADGLGIKLPENWVCSTGRLSASLSAVQQKAAKSLTWRHCLACEGHATTDTDTRFKSRSDHWKIFKIERFCIGLQIREV